MKRRSYITVDVEVDVDEVIDNLTPDEVAEIARDAGFEIRNGGDGDRALQENTIERAYLAVRRMAEVPREVADLFWHVHGRAL